MSVSILAKESVEAVQEGDRWLARAKRGEPGQIQPGAQICALIAIAEYLRAVATGDVRVSVGTPYPDYDYLETDNPAIA